MPKLPFDERLERAAHLVVLARRFYDVWWFYEGADTRPGILKTMNRFPEFFRFDSHAHDVAMVTHLAMLFENRRDTINFEALIDEAERDNLVAPADVAEAKKRLGSISPLRPKLAILRSNLIAHRSDSISYEDAYTKAAITPNQLRDLTEAGRSIVSILLLGRGHSECFFAPTTLSHVKKMLQTLGDSES